MIRKWWKSTEKKQLILRLENIQVLNDSSRINWLNKHRQMKAFKLDRSFSDLLFSSSQVFWNGLVRYCSKWRLSKIFFHIFMHGKVHLRSFREVCVITSLSFGSIHKAYACKNNKLTSNDVISLFMVKLLELDKTINRIQFGKILQKLTNIEHTS